MGVVHKTKGKAVFGSLQGTVVADAGSIGTAELADAAVTLAKQADIATDRLIGRDTAATGVPEALTVGGGVEFSGSGGIQRSALTGDISASAGSATTTIGAAKVLSSMVEEALIQRTATVTIADAAIRTLNSAPTTLIAAPAAGKYIVVDQVVCLNTFATAAYEAGTDTLDISYTNAAGANAATFTNAFLETASTAAAVAVPVAVTPVSAAAITASCNSDPTGGNASSTLKFIVTYHVVTLP
jgi:hypothetical protein